MDSLLETVTYLGYVTLLAIILSLLYIFVQWVKNRINQMIFVSRLK